MRGHTSEVGDEGSERIPTLQVYTNSVEGQAFGETLCCFDGKLLAPVKMGE